MPPRFYTFSVPGAILIMVNILLISEVKLSVLTMAILSILSILAVILDLWMRYNLYKFFQLAASYLHHARTYDQHLLIDAITMLMLKLKDISPTRNAYIRLLDIIKIIEKVREAFINKELPNISYYDIGNALKSVFEESFNNLMVILDTLPVDKDHATLRTSYILKLVRPRNRYPILLLRIGALSSLILFILMVSMNNGSFPFYLVGLLSLMLTTTCTFSIIKLSQPPWRGLDG